jgi:predicted amino acid-binding ACT domain protein
MLARVLEALNNAGAQLEFVLARRASEHTSRVFLHPIKGAKQKQAAAEVGLVTAGGMHALRLDGPDRPGLGAELTRAIADQGINLRGVSAAAIGKTSTTYFAFDNADDAEQAAKVIRKASAKPAAKKSAVARKAKGKKKKSTKKKRSR